MAGTSRIEASRGLAEALVGAVRAAGERIIACRKTGLAVETKSDNSPVTIADREAEAILLAALRTLAPGVPVIAEEEVAAGRVPATDGDFFLVDPLDGTKDFIRGGGDFTVNVGLVRGGTPVLGVVGAPATGEIWAGVDGVGAFAVDMSGVWRPIKVRAAHAGPFDIIASRSHRTKETDDFIARFPGARIVAAGSSLKFCVVAEGGADLYPRLGPTSQWDTAAGDAVLRAAGGRAVTLDGKPLGYGPRDGAGAKAYLNPWFVASGGVEPLPA